LTLSSHGDDDVRSFHADRLIAATIPVCWYNTIMAATQSCQESLETLTVMVNQSVGQPCHQQQINFHPADPSLQLIEIGRFFRASGSMQSRVQLKRTLPAAHEQFQSALDNLSEQIVCFPQ
jgi:hypothetical protein